MEDVVKRLKEINEESLIMGVVRDCLDAAEEIERLRGECESKKEAMKVIKALIVKEEKASTKKSKKSSTSKSKSKKSSS
jgi:hypothetical protein